MSRLDTGKIATVMGRYYAMDQDKRWDRNQRAFEAMVRGQGKKLSVLAEAIKNSYRVETTDEFMEPAVIVDEAQVPIGLVRDGDGVVFFNFRADRTRQITQAFVDQDFSGLQRIIVRRFILFVLLH